MKVDEKISARIWELIRKGDEILMTAETITYTQKSRVPFVRQQSIPPRTTQRRKIEEIKAIQWKTSSSHLLENVFGVGHHLNNFYKATKLLTFDTVKLGIGILNSAKDDYENGYLFDTRTLIEAEVFDDFLEQAEELLKKDYFLASAVIAGCVLEDAVRKLCIKNNITLSAKPKLDSMNSELAKANVYNLLKQKKITALADLRNKAAPNLT